MSLDPTIDDLLADSLIQAVMRADHVEPQALKSLLKRAAGRTFTERRQGIAQNVGAYSASTGRRTMRTNVGHCVLSLCG